MGGCSTPFEEHGRGRGRFAGGGRVGESGSGEGYEDRAGASRDVGR